MNAPPPAENPLPPALPFAERGAIVLCGGRSTRMGLPKATLSFGPETMLARVVRLVSETASTIVVVAAESQELPPLSVPVIVAHDHAPGRGPLEGLAAGLAALPEQVTAAYVTSCDVPLLVPAVPEWLFSLLGENEIIVPREDKFHHPLAAVYRRNVLPYVQQLLAADRLRPVFLFEAARTLEIPVDALRVLDPELATLANLNHPADYLAALQQAGFTAPAEVLEQLGQLE